MSDQRNDALEEALEQLGTIRSDDDDRRKTADAKLSSAQTSISFIVTIAGGSVAVTYLQSPIYDLWHLLVITALTIAVGFFVWAAFQIVSGNDPRPYQSRVPSAVRRLLDEGKTKQQLQRDAINDLVSIIEANNQTTNERMTLYRASMENIQKGVVAAGFIPAIVLIGYLTNTFVGACQLPSFIRIPSGPVTSAARTAQSKGCDDTMGIPSERSAGHMSLADESGLTLMKPYLVVWLLPLSGLIALFAGRYADRRARAARTARTSVQPG